MAKSLCLNPNSANRGKAKKINKKANPYQNLIEFLEKQDKMDFIEHADAVTILFHHGDSIVREEHIDFYGIARWKDIVRLINRISERTDIDTVIHVLDEINNGGKITISRVFGDEE